MKLRISFAAAFALFGVQSVLAEQPACDKLSVADCWQTKGCFLDCGGKDHKRCMPYVCRAAGNDCESEFAQHDLTKERCESRSGCRYSPPECFCPGPMECYCGGGAPAMCRKAG